MPQTYSMVLECGRKILLNETEKDRLSIPIHQLNTRIYNSAFGGVLYEGYPFTVQMDEYDMPTTVEISIDDVLYSCPYSSVSNVLREEFANVLKNAGYQELAEALPTPKKKSVAAPTVSQKTVEKNEVKNVAKNEVKNVTPTKQGNAVKPRANTVENAKKQNTPSAKPQIQQSVNNQGDNKRAIPASTSILPSFNTNITPKKEAPKKNDAPVKKKTTLKPNLGNVKEKKISTQKENNIPSTSVNHQESTEEKDKLQIMAEKKMPDLDLFVGSLAASIKSTSVINLDDMEKGVSSTEDRQKTARQNIDKGKTAIKAEEKKEQETNIQTANANENFTRRTSNVVNLDDMETEDTTDASTENETVMVNTDMQDNHEPDVSENSQVSNIEEEIKQPEEKVKKTVAVISSQHATDNASKIEEDVNNSDKNDETDDYSAFDTPEDEEEDIELVAPTFETKANESFVSKTEQKTEEVKNDEIEDDFKPKNTKESSSSFEPKYQDSNLNAPEASKENVNKSVPENGKNKHGIFAGLFGKSTKRVVKENDDEETFDFQPKARDNTVVSKTVEEFTAKDESFKPQENHVERTEKFSDPQPSKTELKNNEAKDMETSSVTVPAKNEESMSQDHSQDGGTLFQHVHNVSLKPKFGDVTLSEARFIIWPTYVIEMHPGRLFADLLVYVVDKNGTERAYCTERGQDMISVTTSDNKQFNVYGIWDNGHFTSYVTLAGKTESQNRMEETVEKFEPERTDSDAFLDQFRVERKGQPAHFIVPFKNRNYGEQNIPIAGYVETNGRKFPLERRDGNTLRYIYHSNEKVIRGHWEKDKFVINIQDATVIDWSKEENQSSN